MSDSDKAACDFCDATGEVHGNVCPVCKGKKYVEAVTMAAVVRTYAEPILRREMDRLDEAMRASPLLNLLNAKGKAR